jgi:hypothetical protein
MNPPRGRGCWAFQPTTNPTAYDSQLVGEIYWAPGSCTLTEAKAALAATGATGLWAILP